MVKFDCTQCGACCQSIHGDWVGHTELSKRGWILPTGVCSKYDETTRGCSIYSTRPKECSVSEEYKMLNPPVQIEAWFAFVEQCCDKLHMDVYGVQRERGEPCQHRKTS